MASEGERPSNIRQDSAISYWGVGHRKGYSYRRAVGTYLRRVPGRKRRVRYYRYIVVTVPAKEVLVWVEDFSGAVPFEPEKPKVKARWINVREYQHGIETQKSFEGFEPTERELEIYNTSPDRDWIHVPSLFVWPIRKFPYSIPALEKKFRSKLIFWMVRIWFWAIFKKEEEARLWSRTSMIHITDFRGLAGQAQELYNQVLADMEDHDYVEIHELVGWTGFIRGMRTKHKSMKAGGSSE